MEFEPADYDWSDTKNGLIPRARFERLKAVLEEVNERILVALKEHHGPFSIQAMVLPSILATGTRGDRRMYAPIVALFADHFPGYDRLGRIAQAITNTSPISHVIYCATHRIPSDVIGELERAGLPVELGEDGSTFTVVGSAMLLEKASVL